jgi:hypothetical protein
MCEKRLKKILLIDGLMLFFDSNRLLFLFIIKAGDRAFLGSAIAQGMKITSPPSLIRIAEPTGNDDIIVLTCFIKGTR